MELGERFSLGFKILLPVFLLALINVSPLPHAVSRAFQKAQIAGQVGAYQAVAEGIRQVLAHEPWRVSLWEKAGQAEFAAGRFPEAIQAFRSAQAAGTLSTDGLFQLGEAYLQNGQPDEARGVLNEVVQIRQGPANSQSDLVYERLVKIYRARGEYPTVVNVLKEWRTANPQNAQAALLLGLHLTVLQPADALPVLLEAAALEPDTTPTVQVLRFALSQASLSENEAYASVRIGQALGSLGQWDLAGEAFQRAVNADPQYAEAWAFLGEAHYHLDRSGKEALDQAAELNPQSPVVQAMQAFYWRRQRDPTKALAYLERLARQEPDEPAWQVEIGSTLVQKGDLIAATEYFQRAARLAPDNTVYWQHLARFSVQYNMDIANLGLPAARQAVVLSPNDPRALDAMGLVMMRLGDNASAERFLQQAIDRDATYAPAILHLGQLYLQQQEIGRAYAFLRRAASQPGDETVEIIALRLLEQYYGEES